MGCASSKTLQDDLQMQGWIDTVERSFAHGASVLSTPKTAASQGIFCTSLQTADNYLQHTKMKSRVRRDLRSLLHEDKHSLSDDEDYADAPSELTSEELSEANSEKKGDRKSEVSVEVGNIILEPNKLSNILDRPHSKHDLNEYTALAYADNAKQRNGVRFTLEDMLKCPSRSNSDAASARRASEKASAKFSGRSFRLQFIKLQKQTSVLPSVHHRRTKPRKERKAKVVDATKTGCFPARRSPIDSCENKRSGVKHVPKQIEYMNRFASKKGLFYGASLKDDLQQELQTPDLSLRKFSQDDSSSLEQFKAVDTEYITFLPADLQNNGSARCYSNSFDTAEEQFSGDDFSQESEAVSPSNASDIGRSPFNGKKLAEAQNIKLPSRKIVGSTTKLKHPMFSSNADFININKKDERQIEASLDNFESLCQPGGDEQLVLYTTSLQSTRKTYEECSTVRMILQ